MRRVQGDLSLDELLIEAGELVEHRGVIEKPPRDVGRDGDGDEQRDDQHVGKAQAFDNVYQSADLAYAILFWRWGRWWGYGIIQLILTPLYQISTSPSMRTTFLPPTTGGSGWHYRHHGSRRFLQRVEEFSVISLDQVADADAVRPVRHPCLVAVDDLARTVGVVLVGAEVLGVGLRLCGTSPLPCPGT